LCNAINNTAVILKELLHNKSWLLYTIPDTTQKLKFIKHLLNHHYHTAVKHTS